MLIDLQVQKFIKQQELMVQLKSYGASILLAVGASILVGGSVSAEIKIEKIHKEVQERTRMRAQLEAFTSGAAAVICPPTRTEESRLFLIGDVHAPQTPSGFMRARLSAGCNLVPNS